ncbi:antibiotic biosynthesis monooxygenase [Gammaproteobacteria bacterium 45_16_T64]|nr:antibiotic biosynthesis monooxygenase [Gammaproteobacteria bacterium 45_16_T64]
MYAVIFKAKINQLDEHYATTANHLREKALRDYGCTDFTSATEGDYEIAISYWPTLQHIQDWKNDSDHMSARELGKRRWYQGVKIEIIEIKRQYQWGDLE